MKPPKRRKPVSGTESGAEILSERRGRSDGFPVVAFGASAGGFEAFKELLKHLPRDTGMGFVLVQHLDPTHESELARLLARATSMPVREVTNDLRVEPNHVYVIPPNASMGIRGGMLKLQPRPQTRTPHRSIDFFFESLAQDQHERAIGVILSGTATDGTLGLEAIKAEGGFTFAQDESATHDSMPRSAITAGCVDLVLAPESIAQELARIAKHPHVRGKDLITDELRFDRDQRPGSTRIEEGDSLQKKERRKRSGGEDGYEKAVQLLRNHSGVEFSLYKTPTIQRRITRRMVLNKLETLDEYASFLRGNTKELEALYSDVLINVSSFFRNPEAFETLKLKVFPKLIQHAAGQPVRVWVVGCSTGQEAYSIAMAFTEFSDVTSKRQLQIFATDLNEAVLEKARNGLYPKSAVGDVSPDRLRRFFVQENGGYRVSKTLRELCVFARQNLLNDPPFSRMDLISCRNVMIYLQDSVQRKVVPTFHYALKPDGFLLFGASESIGAYAELFEPIDKKQKLYVKKTGPAPALHLRFAPAQPAERAQARGDARPSGGAVPGIPVEVDSQREADRLTLHQYGPPGVLINGDFQVLQFRGDTSAFLKQPAGRANFHLLKMAREGLLLPLQTAINKAKKEGKPVRKENVRVELNGRARAVHIAVMPLKNLKETCYLVLFEEASPTRSAGGRTRNSLQKGTKKARGDARPPSKREQSRIAELEREAAETRDYLQAIQEQHEAANEELQASNEEATSANEELQSVNEELETSKEELESANEELTTVNEEMSNRNTELTRLTGDLNNLHVNINTAILVVSRDLTIRRFTPLAEKTFNLVATDVGRPLNAVRHTLEFAELEDLVREVIDTVSLRHREVQDNTGRWYSLRIRPYMTLDNKVDGAVLVLLDIDSLKRSEQEIKAARDYAEAMIQTARDPLVVLGPDFRVKRANESFFKTFKTSRPETEGRVLYELGNGQWQIPALRQLLDEVIPRNSFFNDFEVTHDFPIIGRRTMLVNGRRLDSTAGTPWRILLGIEDITERRQVEEGKLLLASIVESSDDSIISIDLDGVIRSWNPAAEKLYGYPAKEALGKPLTMLTLSADLQEIVARMERIKSGHVVEEFETERVHKDGHRRRHLSIKLSPIKDLANRVTGVSTIARDITESKRAEETLRQSEAWHRLLMENVKDFAIISTDKRGRIVDWNPGAERVFGYSRREIIGQPATILFTPEDQAAAVPEQELKTAVREGRASDERWHLRKDGGRFFASGAMWPIRDSARELRGFVKVARDISERKKTEEQLRESEERYRTLFDLGPVAVYSIDTSGVIQNFNRRAAELWGREPALGDTDQRFCGSFKMFRPDGSFMPHDLCPMAEVASGKLPAAHDSEVHIERPDGSRVTVIVNIRPLKNARGEITGAINCFYDITERKRSEQALGLRAAQQNALYQLAERANRARTFADICDPALEAILTALPCDRAALLLADDDGLMRFIAWRGLSERYRAAVEGHSPWQRDERDPQIVCIQNVAEAAMEEQLRRVVQREGIAAMAFVPLRHQDRLIGKFMVYWNAANRCGTEELQLCQTIATTVAWAIERKRGEEGLERLVKERTAALRETVGELEGFSYSVAHDLRAPLRAMHGFANLLLEQARQKLEPEELGHLERIARSATRLDGLIQDVLNYTRIMRGDAPVSRVDLDQLVRDVIHSYDVFRPGKAEVSVEGTLPAVLGNSALLTQCVSNLVGNAVKFVAPGTTPKVRIWCEQINLKEGSKESEGGERKPSVRILVQDQGIGIAPHNHPRVFRMFERLHPAAEFEGTGIGLTIVRKAVRRMGGEVGFTSEPGKGSTFWMDLHQAEAE